MTAAPAPAAPPRIRRLPPGLAGRIAAGEVVERPAAALKELIENSLDAGAGRIGIEIEGAGLDLLRVADDGRGIPTDQLALAFERHATSKLPEPEPGADPAAALDRIAGYGFRGEALPAIAAAADELEAVSRARGARSAAALRLRAGRAGGAPAPAARDGGTTISARGLFGPLPARRAFLPGPRAERAALLRACADAALARPDASIRARIDGREAFAHEGAAPGEEPASALRRAMAAVFGDGPAGRAIAIGGEAGTPAGTLRIDGLAGAPRDHRRTRDGIRVFVDARPVRDRALAWSALEACRGRLPAGRFPIAVLRLSAPPGSVDVNVHPAKARVDLLAAAEAGALVRRALRDALARLGPAPLRAGPGLEYAEDAEPSLPAGPRAWPGADLRAPAAGPDPAPLGPDEPDGPAGPGPRAALPPARPAGPAPQSAPGLPPLRMVGQLHRTFIIAEAAQGLILVDQHGAHERILYERLLDAAAAAEAAGPPAAQPLLEPITVSLEPALAAALEQAAPELERLGFEARPFGPRHARLAALPAAIDPPDAERLLLDLLERAAGAQAPPDRFDRAAATAACHGAVRRGRPLDPPAMAAILRGLERCRDPQTCPHGRPTMLELPAEDLLKRFGRK